ncbi:MAG: CRISPR-associated ring nuclease Csm6 [Methylobacter sp.]|nr:CRISPR-associated ring nuclease Csm6 [Methylobacter sp.]
MKPSHHYQKRILLAVSGMSPQIVTETLYSLATREKAPFIPTDIFLITTANGKKQAEQQLLHPDTGKFHQLCTDYALPDINFPADNILVITDAAGELDDIKTPENNEAAADFIIRKVRDLAQDSETALHASIAGGRKTMGYYLGYALSLYGRSQDSLSHVLVTDKYESLKDFFYPTPYSNIIYDREQRSLDTQEAEVMLAEIPFVRLTDGSVPPFLQNERAGFTDSVRWAQALEDEPLLKIDLDRRRLLVSKLEIEVPMADVDFAFYLWVLKRSQEGNFIERNHVIEANKEYADEFLSIYKSVYKEVSQYEPGDSKRTITALKNGMDDGFLSSHLSPIKKAFVDTLGSRAAQPYLIQSLGKKKITKEGEGKYYLITLSEEHIR